MKHIEAPYMFDGEHGIALYAMQQNLASSRAEGEVSCFFSSCIMNLGYFLCEKPCICITSLPLQQTNFLKGNHPMSYS